MGMSFISVIGGIVMMFVVFGSANYYVGRRLYQWMCVIPTGECGQADEKAAPLTLSQIWDVMDEVRENW